MCHFCPLLEWVVLLKLHNPHQNTKYNLVIASAPTISSNIRSKLRYIFVTVGTESRVL